MPKIEEFCHFYMFHRKDAEPAEVFYKEIFSLRSLRLCGELQLQVLRALVQFWHCFFIWCLVAFRAKYQILNTKH